MNKRALRQTYLAKRNELSGSEVAELNSLLCENFLSGFDLAGRKTLHYFLSVADKKEVDTIAIVDGILATFPNIKAIVPRVNNALRELEHIELEQNTSFVESDWGIREPLGDELVNEKLIDLVIVPLLCFDRRGHRVGYGGGYYDKFLAKCRPDCLKLGLSFFGPVEEIEDIHDGDVRLDAVVTPEKLYYFGDR